MSMTFLQLASNDELAQLLLKKRRVTLFAPVDEAFAHVRDFTLQDENRIPTYHVVNTVVTTDMFPTFMYPISRENPPLYFNVKEDTEVDEKEFFVNNAKVLEERDFTISEGHQKLYVIDEVLEPYWSTEYLPPDAWEFLNNPSLYNIKEDLSAMASRVKQEEENTLFSSVGNHTYFIPLTQDNSTEGNRFRDVDKDVIKGHVIPQHVLFTRTAGNKAYKSSNPKVEINLISQNTASTSTHTMFVRSNTLQDDQDHRKGVVLSQIVRANIPVKNGVVHLIQHPLMIIDISIWDFIQTESKGKLSEYMKLVQDASADFQFQLQNSEEKTVFLPTNEAILRLSPEKLANLKRNKTELTKLLLLHMVKKSVSTDDVWHGRIYEMITADNQRSMYFRAVGDRNNKTLTVEAGGVNATAVEADIGATNGIVHVIDRMLGLPYQTVMEKLSTDPDLRRTFQLGTYDDWNLKLNNREKRFTFFAPSQKAWDDLERNMPTEYKQMSMDIYSYHVQKFTRNCVVVKQSVMASIETRMIEYERSSSSAKREPG
ncbi:fasciclin-1-like [Tachypleus tridentatus]|uniref:fasciclin-1-like n=1 Tax=Tachypleus tridentatus TaxID=6853 RepID=UPI003FD2E9FE